MLVGKKMLEEDDYLLSEWKLFKPLLHQQRRLIASTAESLHIYGYIYLHNHLSLALQLKVTIAMRQRAPLQLHERNGSIYLQF